jgi:hypothetical protein
MNTHLLKVFSLSLMIIGLNSPGFAKVVFQGLSEEVQPLADLQPEPAPPAEPAADPAAQSATTSPEPAVSESATAETAGQVTEMPASTAGAAPQKASRKKPAKAKQSPYWATTWVDSTDSIYQFGDRVVFYIRAKRDVYITLLDVGTSGQIHVIFPNKHQRDNFVRAGQTVRVPGPDDSFAIEARPPAGKELIKLIATEQPHAFFDPEDLSEGERFTELLQDSRTLAANLKKILKQRHQNQWNEYSKVIEITSLR